MILKILNLFSESLLAYKIRYRRKKVIFLRESKIRKCSFEGNNSIGLNNNLNHVAVGFGTYTGRNVQLSRVKIGKFCSIGSFIRNTTGRHPTKLFVSTHPAFFSIGKAAGFTYSKQQMFNELNYNQDKFLLTIGNDVWIGDNVTIMDGLVIGDGAIIGSGAVVTKNIEPYSINVGVPARKISSRFKDDEISWLLNFKWWNKDADWLTRNSGFFSDLGNFKKKFTNE